MSSDDTLCSVLSTRNLQSINTFSSTVQNKFRTNHDTFNLRYGAFLRIKSTMLTFKKETLENSSKKHIEKLADTVSRLDPSSRKMSQRQIQLNFLSTGLSAPDREYLLPFIIQRLKRVKHTEVLEIHCCNNVSVHDLLFEIGDVLIRKFVVRQCRNFMSNEYLLQSKKLFDMLKDSPTHVIRLLFGKEQPFGRSSSNSNGKLSSDSETTSQKTLVLLLRHVRRLSTTLLGDLVLRLAAADLTVSIVAVVDELGPLPLPTDRTALALTDVTIQQLPGPKALLDELLGRIYTSGEVPVLFPRVIIEAVREACDCFNLCITSTVEKLILCVGIHFQRRRSILTLCGRSDWLEELGLRGFKRAGADVISSTSHALSRLLPLVGASDLQGVPTGILLSPERNGSRGEDRSVLAANTTLFRRYFDRLSFDKLVYDCLKLCRDELINEVSRSMLPADLLWSALISGAERYKMGASSKILGEMLRTVQLGLSQLKLPTLRTTVDKLCEIVKRVQQLGVNVSTEDDAAAKQYLEHLGGIFDVKLTLDAISSLPTLSIAVRVNAQSSDVAFLAPLDSTVANEGDQGTPICDEFFSPQELLALQRDRVSGCATAESHEAESLSGADMFAFARDDLMRWLTVTTEQHCRMPELVSVATIFRLDDSELQTLVGCSDTNLQMMFASALEDPSRFFRPAKGATSSCVRFDSTDLYDKFRDLRGQIVANEWIYGLSVFGEQWRQDISGITSGSIVGTNRQITSSSGPPSKKSRVVANIGLDEFETFPEDNDDEEDEEGAAGMHYSAEMRSRFAFALSDMERAGLLRCKRVNRSELVTITREMHTWLGGGASEA